MQSTSTIQRATYAQHAVARRTQARAQLAPPLQRLFSLHERAAGQLRRLRDAPGRWVQHKPRQPGRALRPALRRHHGRAGQIGGGALRKQHYSSVIRN
jgi:hypothetical protein